MMLLSYKFCFRILNNFPMHTFAIGNVISGKGILFKPNK